MKSPTLSCQSCLCECTKCYANESGIWFECEGCRQSIRLELDAEDRGDTAWYEERLENDDPDEYRRLLTWREHLRGNPVPAAEEGLILPYALRYARVA